MMFAAMLPSCLLFDAATRLLLLMFAIAAMPLRYAAGLMLLLLLLDAATFRCC